MPFSVSESAIATAPRLAVCYVLLYALWGCVRTKEKMYTNKKKRKNEATQLAGRCIVFAFAPVVAHSFIHIHTYVCLVVNMCVYAVNHPARCRYPNHCRFGHRAGDQFSVSVYSIVVSSWLLLLFLLACLLYFIFFFRFRICHHHHHRIQLHPYKYTYIHTYLS